MSSATLDRLHADTTVGARRQVHHIRSRRMSGDSRGRPAPEISPPPRLTRRGRLVIVVAVLAVAFAAFVLVGAPAASTATAHHSTVPTVVVQPGQTLWDIAAAARPGADPRLVVAAIMELNDLVDPGAIRAGRPLYVPSRR